MKEILIGLGIGLVISLFYYFDTFYLFENNIQDRLMTDEGQGDLRVKIIAIDDASLNEIGRWPWSRNVMADVAEDLLEAGASAVWLDLVFSEQSEDTIEDEKMQQIIEKYEQLYLSVYFNFATVQDDAEQMNYISYQAPIYSIPDEQIGHINVLQDSDRVVRKSILGIRKDDGTMVPAINVKLANLLLADNKQLNFNETNNEWKYGHEDIKTSKRNEVIFSYVSNPTDSSFDVFSFKDVWDGKIPASTFKNSIILIGTYTVGLQDQYLTPMSQTVPMNGVEIHANIIQSLVEGNIYRELSVATGLILIIALSMIGYYAIQRLSSKFVIFAVISIFILYIVGFLLTLQQFHLIIPLFYPLLAIVFIYIATIVNHFIKEQMEKKRITNIFGRYVSKNIVDELIEADDEVTLVGERKDVTLMFVDMRGFTSLSEKMEPEEVVEVLNEYLNLCSQAIFAYEGTIDKFMGDGIMVIFGAPVSQEDHALRAVKTAIKMQEQGEILTEKLLHKYEKSVAFGIGINSGPAVVGNIGSQERLDYTAIGDTVNLAARLESSAQPKQILISRGTYELVKNNVECRILDPIKVKGKSDPISIFEII